MRPQPALPLLACGRVTEHGIRTHLMEQLIPDASFAVMPQFMLIVVTVAATWFLIKGADWLVDGAVEMANRLGIPKVIIGATVVSLGTTSPEAAVSVMAAWANKPGLALGNAVGSIIVDTGLIFGLGCVLVVLPADRFVLKRQGLVKVMVCGLLAVICYGLFIANSDQATLGRWVGVVLVVLLAAYLAMSSLWGLKHPHGEPFIDPGSADAGGAPRGKSVAILIGCGLGGLVLVVFSSRFLIGSVSQLAIEWGIPRVVIASTIVALGTSLPELVVGMTALVKGHRELLVGNVIGADILNVLFVVGASSLAAPLPIIDPGANHPRLFLFLHLPTMLIMASLFLVYILVAVRRGAFYKWFGYPLLVLYAVYIAGQYLLESGG